MVHVRTRRRSERAPLPDRDGLVELEQVRRDRPGFLTTPKRLAPMMSAVAANLALCLPVKSLTDREMSRFLAGIAIDTPDSFDPSDRRFSGEVSIWPPTYMAKRRFFPLLCVPPSPSRFLPASSH